jgi:hypothetical protein
MTVKKILASEVAAVAAIGAAVAGMTPIAMASTIPAGIQQPVAGGPYAQTPESDYGGDNPDSDSGSGQGIGSDDTATKGNDVGIADVLLPSHRREGAVDEGRRGSGAEDSWDDRKAEGSWDDRKAEGSWDDRKTEGSWDDRKTEGSWDDQFEELFEDVRDTGEAPPASNQAGVIEKLRLDAEAEKLRLDAEAEADSADQWKTRSEVEPGARSVWDVADAGPPKSAPW